MLSQNIREEVWKQFEENAVLTTEYQKLGIDISDKELNDMLVGRVPPTDAGRKVICWLVPMRFRR